MHGSNVTLGVKGGTKLDLALRTLGLVLQQILLQLLFQPSFFFEDLLPKLFAVSLLHVILETTSYTLMTGLALQDFFFFL